MMGDRFWLNDYTVLLTYWHEFFPTADMTPVERLNALSRFVIYAAALVAAIRKDVSVLQYAFIGLVLVAIAFKSGKPAAAPRKKSAPWSPLRVSTIKGHLPTTSEDNDTSAGCVGPTPDNPMMNRLFGETRDKPSCLHADQETAERSEQMWRRGLYQNVEDVYNTHLSSRQFYTNPDNRLPNDQTSFAMALYGDNVRNRGGTCKEDTTECGKY